MMSSDRNEGSIILRMKRGRVDEESIGGVYSKHDIWITSASSSFEKSSVYTSSWWGISSGSIELVPFRNKFSDIFELEESSDLRCGPVDIFAIRCFNASTEVSILQILSEIEYADVSLLPYLLGPPAIPQKRKFVSPLVIMKGYQSTVAKTRAALIDGKNIKQTQKILVDTCKEYMLNEDQTEVIQQVFNTFYGIPSINNPTNSAIVLCQGVFGAGKSYMVTILIFLLGKIKNATLFNMDFKVCLTAMTNVAVDGILIKLIEMGFDDLVRIGSLKKIARCVLPFTMKKSESGDSNCSNEIRDLEDMLVQVDQNALQDRRDIEAALENFKSTKNNIGINDVLLVAATCQSSLFTAVDVIDKDTVGLLIVDEISQLLEPVILMPITRFGAKCMVLIGDPLQLPPNIPNGFSGNGKGLEQSLFSRLASDPTSPQEGWLAPVVLRTQYRCHPQISEISNKLFYDNVLVDHTTPETRPPLLDTLPPVLFVQSDGIESPIKGGSFVNVRECEIIVELVKTLVEKFNIAEIGVISLCN